MTTICCNLFINNQSYILTNTKMGLKIIQETERCSQIIQDLVMFGKDNSVRQFAFTNGLHPQGINSVLAKERNVTIPVIRLLINKYNANPYFIYMGIPPMYSKTTSPMTSVKKENSADELAAFEEKVTKAMRHIKSSLESKIENLESRMKILEGKNSGEPKPNKSKGLDSLLDE